MAAAFNRGTAVRCGNPNFLSASDIASADEVLGYERVALNTGHALFSPSKSHMWLACPGSMAFPENQDPDGGSSTYADDGSATHAFAASWLQGFKAEAVHVNGKAYGIDEERAERVQGYVDDVRRRAASGYLFVERRVDLSGILGPDQGGTADAVIVLPHKRMGIIEDLKDGSGEKVYASLDGAPNPQLALYALGALPELELFGPIDNVTLVIYQPKLGHIDEHTVTVDELRRFGAKARAAVELAQAAMAAGPTSITTEGYLNPGAKQCRWCRAKSRCPALARFVADEVRLDFDEGVPGVPVVDFKELAKHYASIPLIEIWIKAIKAELEAQVANGAQVIGPDGKAYKFVEGKAGDRKWSDEKAAEAALVGLLGPKAYTEPKVLTAPAASKLIKGPAWKDVFEPMIKRALGKPTLTLGSDPRPAAVGANANEFEDELNS